MQGQQAIRLLKQAGFTGEALKTAWALMMRESGGNAQAFNPNRATGDQSYGLFQINMLGNLGPARRKQFGLRSNEDLLDPLTNAKVAYRMSAGGTNWGPWGLGPNAYKGAPSNAKTKYQQWLTKYPGDDAKAQLQPTGGMFSQNSSQSPQQIDNEQALAMQTRQLLGERMRERAVARRAGRPPALGGLIQFAKDRRALQAMLPEITQSKTAGPVPVQADYDSEPTNTKGEYDYGSFRAAFGGADFTPLGGPSAHLAKHDSGENWESNNAWDYGLPEGTPIYALEDGIIGPNVGAMEGRPGDGARVTINGSGNSYWYGHLSAVRVKPGQRVRKGQLIGLSGKSANGAAHLHLGVRNIGRR